MKEASRADANRHIIRVSGGGIRIRRVDDAGKHQCDGDVRVRLWRASDTSIATVRDAAINHFRLSNEPASAFYLTDRNQRVSEAATIGEVAGGAPNVVLKLVQG